MQTHVQRSPDNKGAPSSSQTETPSVVPTIRMLSGLPDVVLTHVQRLERVERAQRRVTPEAPEASARGHAGGRDKRDRERERKGEARGSGRTKRKNFAYLFFFRRT